MTSEERTGRLAVVRVRLARPADDVWSLVTDVRHHARWVPWTRVDAAARLAPGDTFTAVTGPGARRGLPGIPDRMVVDRLDPPEPATGAAGRASYRKLGPVLLGTAEVHVLPAGDAGSIVVWTEEVWLRGLPRVLSAPVLRVALGAMLRVVVRRLNAEGRELPRGPRRRGPTRVRRVSPPRARPR